MRRVQVGVCALAVAAAAIVVNAQGSGVFFHESWEEGTTSSSFNSQSYGTLGPPQFQAQNSVRAAGAWALQHLITAGTSPDQIDYATQHFGDAPTGPVPAAGRGEHFYDLYVQYKFYYSPGFNVTSGYKQFIIGTQDDRRHDNACCNPSMANYMFTVIYSVPGGFAKISAEGNNKQAASGQWMTYTQNASGYSTSNLFRLQTGRWYTVEVRRRLNDPNEDNGIFQMWVDGTLISDHRSVRFRTPWNGTFGTNFQYGTNLVMLSDYAATALPQDQSIYYDDVIFSTSYIGGGGGTSPTAPGPPTNVRVIR
jgi:hypothetical protein